MFDGFAQSSHYIIIVLPYMCWMLHFENFRLMVCLNWPQLLKVTNMLTRTLSVILTLYTYCILTAMHEQILYRFHMKSQVWMVSPRKFYKYKVLTSTEKCSCHFLTLLLSSSSISTAAPCGLWPVKQYPAIFSYLSPTLSISSLLALEDPFLPIFS